MTALIGRKIGMTRYNVTEGRDAGKNIPVTVIEVGPCVVTQVKTTETDGYTAIQIGFDERKPRRATMPLIGHDAKAGAAPMRVHREIRFENDSEAEAYTAGQTLDVTSFEGMAFVDVIATSKGKGFAGTMKRHNFKGKEASHGVKRAHRRPGSINGHATNLGTGPKLKKGKRMSGRMGGVQVTTRSLDLVAIDAERQLLIVKGAVPGPNQGDVMLRPPSRLNRKKARFAANAGK